MKNPFKRLFSSLTSGLITGAIVTSAVLLPIATSAQDAVTISGSTGIANVTAGDTAYKQAVDASDGQVVKVQVYNLNQQDANSGQVANNLRVKVAMPAAAGRAQTITTTTKADNSNQVSNQVTANLNLDGAYLQYVPGSAIWKHNTGTNDALVVEETKLSDDIVSANGIVLENQKPGYNFASTVTVLARVMNPSVKLTTESQVRGQTNQWSNNNTAKPGEVMKYIVSYQNTGSAEQQQVVIRATLPAKASLVPGTTTVFNGNNQNGFKFNGDGISDGGIIIGNYGPGANAYVTYEVQLPAADQLACGNNEFKSVGYAKPQGASEYASNTVTTVKRDCAAAPAANPPAANAPASNQNGSKPQTATQPTYSCDLLTVTKSTEANSRKITAKVDYTAKDGAKLKNISYNFGDASQPLLTDKTSVEYTYPKDGTYTVTATLTVTVDGKDQTVTSAPCAKPVSFTAPAAPAAPAAAAANAELPATGIGSVAGVFIAASIVGFIGHRLLIARRLARG